MTPLVPVGLIPKEDADLDPVAGEIRVLIIHGTLVMAVLMCTLTLAILHDIDGQVVTAIFSAALTFAGTRSTQASGRSRAARVARRSTDG